MRRAGRWIRWLLGSVVLAVVLPLSCGAGFAPESQVTTLRILAVTADQPYARPGEDVTFSMTLFDGLGKQPRDIQVLWLAGCFNPEGDLYYLCFEQLAGLFDELESGSFEGLTEWAKLSVVSAEQSGEPRVEPFTVRVPDDILVGRAVDDSGVTYGIGFVLFAACAGTFAPGDPGDIEAWTSGETPSFPLRCLDSLGQELGAESFVPGYTQLWVFEDDRRNGNPLIDGMILDGATMQEMNDELPTVAPCAKTDEQRRSSGCLSDTGDDCTSYRIQALIGDVAEIAPGSTGADGQALREIVWVSYFADVGSFSRDIVLVSDAVEGYLGGDHDTEWTPPAESGIATIWAVARDQRGGGSIIRRQVRVER